MRLILPSSCLCMLSRLLSAFVFFISLGSQVPAYFADRNCFGLWKLALQWSTSGTIHATTSLRVVLSSGTLVSSTDSGGNAMTRVSV